MCGHDMPLSWFLQQPCSILSLQKFAAAQASFAWSVPPIPTLAAKLASPVMVASENSRDEVGCNENPATDLAIQVGSKLTAAVQVVLERNGGSQSHSPEKIAD